MNQADATPPAAPRRVLSLDAVRGLAILLMCLSGVVPRYLPNWMYHGYYPQHLPDDAGTWSRVANPWAFWPGPAFTWVDWVFPMFLFAMGAAIPLALSRRVERGGGWWRAAGHALWRGVVLIGFAVYVQQITPGFIKGGDATNTADLLLALAGFALLFPVLTRLPRTWKRGAVLGVRLGGLAAAVGLLWLIHERADRAFSWNQKDIIILLLAWMAIFASLLWLATPGRWWPVRLVVGLAAAGLAHHQAMKPQWRAFGDAFDGWMPVLNGWPKAALDLTWIADTPLLDLSALYDFTWLKFAWIVVPGTVIGDRLLRYMSEDAQPTEPGTRAARPGRLWLVAALLAGAIVVVHAAYAYRGPVLVTLGPAEVARGWLIALAAAALSGAAWLALRAQRQGVGGLLRSLAGWAAVWLAVGLLAEPFEGGIKKGPPSTLSYYLMSLALTIQLLAALVVAVDVWRHGRRWFGWLVAVGQNPMLAYAAIRNLVAPVVTLPLLAPLNDATEAIHHDSIDAVMLHDALGATDSAGQTLPWLQFVWALVKTLGLAAVTVVFTRLRLVWRV